MSLETHNKVAELLSDLTRMHLDSLLNKDFNSAADESKRFKGPFLKKNDFFFFKQIDLETLKTKRLLMRVGRDSLETQSRETGLILCPLFIPLCEKKRTCRNWGI